MRSLYDTFRNPDNVLLVSYPDAQPVVESFLYDLSGRLVSPVSFWAKQASSYTITRWRSAAVGALMNKNAAIQEASFAAGIVYGERITPSWIRIDRDYFRKSKGDPYMAEGARMMEVNDWDSAIEALETAVETGHPKTKGRAAHNLAVVYEILGNLDEAKRWASDAWGRYGNKKSRDYGYHLTRRINEQRVLEQQLGE